MKENTVPLTWALFRETDIRDPLGSVVQGVKFLFFRIFSYFSQHTPIFPIF